MTTAPGTQSYMPPEALKHNPTYNTKIDCFSCGVMILHVLCGRWPLPDEAIRVNPSDPHQLIPLTEAERREEYLQEIGEDHPLMALIQECLSNHPPLRPDAEEILRRVREVSSQFPPSFENKVEMLHRLKTASDSQQGTSTDEREKLIDLLQVEQIRTRLSEVSAEKEGMSTLLRAKELECVANVQELEAKRQELAAKCLDVEAKELQLDAKQQEVNAKDYILAAKEATIEDLRSQLRQSMQVFPFVFFRKIPIV